VAAPQPREVEDPLKETPPPLGPFPSTGPTGTPIRALRPPPIALPRLEVGVQFDPSDQASRERLDGVVYATLVHPAVGRCLRVSQAERPDLDQVITPRGLSGDYATRALSGPRRRSRSQVSSRAAQITRARPILISRLSHFLSKATVKTTRPGMNKTSDRHVWRRVSKRCRRGALAA
jgi:hypothetical protein